MERGETERREIKRGKPGRNGVVTYTAAYPGGK